MSDGLSAKKLKIAKNLLGAWSQVSKHFRGSVITRLRELKDAIELLFNPLSYFHNISAQKGLFCLISRKCDESRSFRLEQTNYFNFKCLTCKWNTRGR
jgi:hypothetical protein